MMNVLGLLLQAGLFTSAIVIYFIFFRKNIVRGHYRQAGWNYYLKLLIARVIVKYWKSKLNTSELYDTPRPNQRDGFDAFTIKASAPDGSTIILGIKKLCGFKSCSEIFVSLKLADGNSYQLPESSEKYAWKDTAEGWSAGGLSIQVLEPQNRFRILFNGLLKRSDDDETRHVKLNLIWASATKVIRYPEDWSDELASEALALDSWQGRAWTEGLNKYGSQSGSWLQFGAVQGRFICYDAEGKIETSEYLRARGIKERSWAPTSGQLRRCITLTASTAEGTAIHLQGTSYQNSTSCISGTVRFPNFKVHGISSTDLDLSKFCETAEEIPKAYTIHIRAGGKSFKIVLRISKNGDRLFSGMYQEWKNIYRFVAVEINGEHGTGILEIGYENEDKLTSPLRPTRTPRLKWLDVKTIKDSIKYCHQFEEPVATCVEYVGGKGASLALLSSVQEDQDYRVPPGFCITTKALESFLEMNPGIQDAISQIAAAGAKYGETVFKTKCNETVEQFLKGEIKGQLKEEIVQNVAIVRNKVGEQNLGCETRFAVRSSAVGEDSEALSAAGQNETVLGIRSEDDVLRAVLKCWASMFAFTSAYYRRQNGQQCECGGAVVVQALVAARTAGVMFTRHPDAGDPSRILITANYGLGESVVSGAVEPDTIIIKRGSHNKVSIAKVDLGKKSQKIVASSDGIETEEVSDSERNVSCLSEEEMLRLAAIGVEQEQLWGAGRDIEWAIDKEGKIYLLQARPITSLERWTEEELLHELDLPVMADDELITFANTGEVLPKPFTALTYDMVIDPLERGITSKVPGDCDGYDISVAVTHNRAAIALYNTVYRKVPKEMDIGLRMLEISIHGHKVADDSILSTAMHRRAPRRTDKLISIINMIKNLMVSKKCMNDTIKRVTNLNIGTSDGVLEMYNNICGVEKDIFVHCVNHATTSVASSFTQFIAMSVLLEGKSDFSPEQCNEISTLLSSGDVLSAEVPLGLAKLAQMLQDSGSIEEFRKQNPNEAINWLRDNLPNVHDEVQKFLECHGHRAIMEFELTTKPWALVPEDLMKVLMHVVPSKENKQAKSSDEIIASLKTPQKANTRKALRWILPLCQRTVRYRESTKAHLILAIHKLRLAGIHLGKLMVRDWYLPEYELVFYFRLGELKKFIETRDPALLKKAVQRKQYSSNWCKLKFAEINKGWVQPLKSDGPRICSNGDEKLSGTSVCGGEVVARACVVRDLSEIDQLRQGDILITHATDIGWSPYFPVLAGIVTELGGLISHGAVIAREYGLPSIVGVVDATSVFRTGDMVRLSGNSGLIEKVTIDTTEVDS